MAAVDGDLIELLDEAVNSLSPDARELCDAVGILNALKSKVTQARPADLVHGARTPGGRQVRQVQIS